MSWLLQAMCTAQRVREMSMMTQLLLLGLLPSQVQVPPLRQALTVEDADMCGRQAECQNRERCCFPMRWVHHVQTGDASCGLTEPFHIVYVGDHDEMDVGVERRRTFLLGSTMQARGSKDRINPTSSMADLGGNTAWKDALYKMLGK